MIGPGGEILVGDSRHAVVRLSPAGEVLAQLRPGIWGRLFAMNPVTGELAYSGFDPQAGGHYGTGVLEILDVGRFQPNWRLETGTSAGTVGLGFGAGGGLAYLAQATSVSTLSLKDTPGAPLLQISNEVSHPLALIGRPAAGDWVVSFRSHAPLAFRGEILTTGKGALLLSVGAQGALKWSRYLPDAGGWGHRLAANAGGALALAGGAHSRAEWGPQVGPRTGSPGFLARLSPEGVVLWVRDLSSEAIDAVAIDDLGEIVVASPRNGCGGLTLRAFNAAGLERWTHVLNPTACGEGEISATGLAITPEGDVLLSGRLQGAVELGGQRFQPSNTETFVLRLAAPPR